MDLEDNKAVRHLYISRAPHYKNIQTDTCGLNYTAPLSRLSL